MPVFAVMSLDSREQTEGRVIELGLPFYPVGSLGLMVAFKGTSEELSNQLGITDGQTGRAIVIAVGDYYGFAPPGLWEWINVHRND